MLAHGSGSAAPGAPWPFALMFIGQSEVPADALTPDGAQIFVDWVLDYAGALAAQFDLQSLRWVAPRARSAMERITASLDDSARTDWLARAKTTLDRRGLTSLLRQHGLAAMHEDLAHARAGIETGLISLITGNARPGVGVE